MVLKLLGIALATGSCRGMGAVFKFLGYGPVLGAVFVARGLIGGAGAGPSARWP